MMKIYLAGRFSKRHVLNELGNFLQGLGHTITSRWTLPDTDHVKPSGMSEQAADSERIYKKLRSKQHPDKGGDKDLYHVINVAWEQAKRELTV